MSYAGAIAAFGPSPCGELDYLVQHLICRLEDRQSAPPLTGKQLDALEALERRIARAESNLLLYGYAIVDDPNAVDCQSCRDTGVRDGIGYCRDCGRRP